MWTNTIDRAEQMLASPEYSDFTIVCKGVEFQVHRAVICKVPYFSKLCGDEIQESDTRKSDLSEYEPGIVARMIFFVYTGIYCDYDVPHVFLDRCHLFEALANPDDGGDYEQNGGDQRDDGDHNPISGDEHDSDDTEEHVADADDAGEHDLDDDEEHFPVGIEDDNLNHGEEHYPQDNSALPVMDDGPLTPPLGWEASPTPTGWGGPAARESALRMRVSTMVYKLAGMLGLEELKTLSANLAYHNVKTTYTEPEFHSAIAFFYENTRKGDKLRRRITTFFALADHGPVRLSSDIADVLQEHDAEQWETCSGVLDDCRGLGAGGVGVTVTMLQRLQLQCLHGLPVQFGSTKSSWGYNPDSPWHVEGHVTVQCSCVTCGQHLDNGGCGWD